MTTAHFFFIPSIFFLGFFAGAAISNHWPQKKAAKSRVTYNRKTRFTPLLGATFGAFVIVFIITHMIPFSGGAKSLQATLGNQPLFDQRTSSTADEVYNRLDNFGAAGRAAYQNFTFSGDLFFPLSLFAFLIVLAHFVRERTLATGALRPILISIPIFWFLSDLIENSVIYYLISQYPQKNIFLASNLATITNLKFILLLGAIALPAVSYAIAQGATHEKTIKA